MRVTIIPYRGMRCPRTLPGPRPTRAGNWHSDRMRARSALFDVYGDHLRARGDQAPVAALVRLLEPVGIAAPAVRTAISRMAAQGWLEPARVDAAPGLPRLSACHRAALRGGRPHLPQRAGALGRALAAGLPRGHRVSAASASGCGGS